VLEEKYSVGADVWSVTSYKELRRDALDADRWNLLNPGKPPRIPYITQCLARSPGVCVAVSDFMKALPDSVAKWIPRPLISLGTEGFGRSESRQALRDFFEIDSRYVALAALHGLAREKQVHADLVRRAAKDLDINPEKLNPMTS